MKLLEVKKVIITKSIAEQWAKMESCPHDRPLNPRRCAALKADIDKGIAIPFIWARAKIGDKFIRVNGKHSSVAISQMDSIPANLIATIQDYACEDMADVAILYAQFDGAKNARSQRDVNRAVQFSSSLEDCRIHAFDACTTGIIFAKTQSTKIGEVGLSPEERPLVTIAEEEFVRWYLSLTGSDESMDMMERKAVVCAMYLTWKKRKLEATQFWVAVRDGTEQVGSPTRVLQKYLLKTSVASNNTKTSRSEDTMTMAIRCIHAWNAWRNKGQTDLKVYSKKLPRVD